MVRTLGLHKRAGQKSTDLSEVTSKSNSPQQGSSSTITYSPDSSEEDLLARIDEDEILISPTASSVQTETVPEVENVIDKKRVSFSNVNFRVFYTTLGDNPVSTDVASVSMKDVSTPDPSLHFTRAASPPIILQACSHGPPLTIEWNHFGTQEMSVEDWEEHRPWRRHGSQLKIPWLDRRQMLTSQVSEREILLANEAVRQAQEQRRQTVHRQKYEKLELLAQRVVGKMRRAFLSPRMASKQKLGAFGGGEPELSETENSHGGGQNLRLQMLRRSSSTSRIPSSGNGPTRSMDRWKKWSSERHLNTR